MISNRELKDEIEQLSEHNQLLTQELQSIKELLIQQSANKDSNKDSGSAGSSKNNKDEANGGNQPNSSNVDSSKDATTTKGSSSQKNSSTDSADSAGKSDNQDKELSAIATDFSMLKDLTSELEVKMQSYIQNSSSGGDTLTNEDAVNLVLAIMNGMIDWTMDMVSKPSSN
ncbi:hypothetical protein [Paenibacillus agricola]|uniref:Uncharacterized protein n=1 Tax=Paenibacillus agricola TaxID=2716264 RepID=A0ABX0J132_9BACL|nr:hypothetical protein [Paenibacillus agricola]NHN28819.1 hypothetical protein [Paenibacillus agricola]